MNASSRRTSARFLFPAGAAALVLVGVLVMWWLAADGVDRNAGSDASGRRIDAESPAASSVDSDAPVDAMPIARAPFADVDPEEPSAAAAAPVPEDGMSSLRMTLVLPDGKPASSGFVEVEQRGARICQNRADRDGVAVFRNVTIDGGPLRILVGHARKRYFATRDAPTVEDATKRPALDLGAITLEETAPWCAGRVVDPDGRPAAFARLKIKAVDAPSPSSAVASPAAFDVVVRAKPIELQGPYIDGLFSIHTEDAVSTIEVVVSAENRVDADPVVLQRGATGVELRTGAATGRLAGTIADNGPLPPGLEAVARPEWLAAEADADTLFARSIRCEVGPDRKFSFRGLPPGAYELRLVLPSAVEAGRRPLAIIAGVVVPAGGAAADPRLVDIVVSSGFVQATIRLVDEAGAPVDGCRAVYAGRAFDCKEGTVALAGVAFPFDVAIEDPTRKYRRLRSSVDGDRTLVMRPKLEVELRVNGDVALLAGGPRLHLPPDGKRRGWNKSWIDPERHRVEDGASAKSERRLWRYLLDEPGDYELLWAFRPEAAEIDGTLHASGRYDPRTPRSRERIEIRDVAGVQTLVVDLPTEPAQRDPDRK
jgi:hypothetical protein